MKSTHNKNEDIKYIALIIRSAFPLNQTQGVQNISLNACSEKHIHNMLS